MKGKKNIVVYSGKFGLEFSGGCIATCRILESIQDYFSSIIVLSQEIGSYNIKNLEHIPCNSIQEATQTLRTTDFEPSIFYGDFFDSIAFVKANVPFYFTYHDNWPEQKNLGEKEFMESFYFESVYQEIFKKAKMVFSVSDFKLNYIRQFTDKTTIIRNGIQQPIHQKKESRKQRDTFKILMTGNIDKRKYEKSIEVFSYLNDQEYQNIEIDIFGWKNDKDISSSLQAFPFVHLKGYEKIIHYSNYDLYLSTSFIENLSISVVIKK